ncbi:MAG: YqaE/Pmp3 family membrane protein [Anaerolineae bacterium]|nr:YqaE/Pmp3 family membrane protein [Anaerolineae bacterium]
MDRENHDNGPLFFRLLLAVIFPPIAVLDRGCGTILLVGILTLAGWVPGIILALILVLTNNRREPTRYVRVPRVDGDDYEYEAPEKRKRDPAYIHLMDGEVAEVVEDDGAPLFKRKNR